MKVIAVLLIVLALVIGVLPFFTDCESQGRVLTLASGKEIPMKCHWTGRAEIVTAALLLLTGILTGISKKRESLRNLSLISALLGVLVILLPTVLIGVCSNPDMICNSIMKPTLILMGSLVAVLSVLVSSGHLGRTEKRFDLQATRLEKYPG